MAELRLGALGLVANNVSCVRRQNPEGLYTFVCTIAANTRLMHGAKALCTLRLNSGLEPAVGHSLTPITSPSELTIPGGSRAHTAPQTPQHEGPKIPRVDSANTPCDQSFDPTCPLPKMYIQVDGMKMHLKGLHEIHVIKTCALAIDSNAHLAISYTFPSTLIQDVRNLIAFHTRLADELRSSSSPAGLGGAHVGSRLDQKNSCLLGSHERTDSIGSVGTKFGEHLRRESIERSTDGVTIVRKMIVNKMQLVVTIAFKNFQIVRNRSIMLHRYEDSSFHNFIWVHLNHQLRHLLPRFRWLETSAAQ